MMFRKTYEFIALPFIQLHIKGWYKMMTYPDLYIGWCVALLFSIITKISGYGNSISIWYLALIFAAISFVVSTSTANRMWEDAETNQSVYLARSCAPNIIITVVVLFALILANHTL